MIEVVGRAFLAVLLVAAGCGGDDDQSDDGPSGTDAGNPDADGTPVFEAGEAITLTGDNPAEDEDPFVLAAANGTMVVAWFGYVDGNADLFVATARAGETWSEPVRITTSAAADFAPQLAQASDGWFHLTWFRRDGPPDNFARVRHTRTRDLAVWPDGDGAAVADADPVEDWVPTIAERPDGVLQIVFVSHIRGESEPHELYSVTSSDGGATWSEVVPLDQLNDAAEQDHLPYLARTGDQLTITWNRCDADPAIPWENPTSDLFVATSPDGDAWSEPRAITGDDEAGVLDVFPALYASHAGDWSLLWVTTALEATGSVVDLPIAGSYPADRGAVPEMTGYSPRVAATPTDGVYLGAWVEGPTGEQDVRVRFFAR